MSVNYDTLIPPLPLILYDSHSFRDGPEPKIPLTHYRKEAVLNNTPMYDHSIKNLKLHGVLKCTTLVKDVTLTLKSLEINLQTLLVHEASVYFCWNRA